MFLLDKVKKSKLSVLSATVGAVLLLSACEKEAAPTQAAALPIDVYTVSTADVPVVSRLTGRANSTRRAEVRPQVSGVIQKRLFTEGANIEEGTQLYQIDPAIYQAQYDSAKASLSSAKANLHAAKLRADRYRALLSRNAVSRQDYDDANATYLQAAATVEQAEAAVQTAEINLAYTKVYAPISGRISRSNVTEGALVSAQQAEPLTTIQQLDPMYVDLGQSVEAHLQMRDAMEHGQFKMVDGKATVDIYYSNGEKYPYQGTLEFSEVSVDETTGMVNLRAIVPNPKQVLLPGMFLRGDINEGVIPNAVIVDQSAVTREAAGVSYVMVVDSDNKVQRRNVKIGTNYDKYFVVIDGLKPGEKVATSNLQKLRSGTLVSIVDLPDTAEAAEGSPAQDNAQQGQ